MGDALERDNLNDIQDASQTSVDPAAQQSDPDALYDLGMAYYRRRHWRQAKACFEQLHALQPTRRGVEALLRELDIFLQLESVESEATLDAQLTVGTPPPLAFGATAPRESAADLELRVVEPEPARAPAKPRWWVAPLVTLAAAVIVGGVYLVVSGRLSPAESEVGLRNQMQSYLVAQRYCKALELGTKLEAVAPGDLEALNAIDKSKQRLYEEAHDYARLNGIERALANLECIYLYDPNYQDVPALMDSLRVRSELSELYTQARQELMGTGAYGQAITLLLKIRALDPTYQPGTISDDLFEAYTSEARQWLELVRDALQPMHRPEADLPQYEISEDTLVKVREASKAYERALGERPEDAAALQGKALADGLYEAMQRYINWTWPACVAKLDELYRVEPTYLSGKLAALLCDANLRLAAAHYQSEEFAKAVAVYQSLLADGLCDPALVATLAYQAGLPLTPTMTPTETPEPTATLTPTPAPTSTAMPSPTRTTTRTPTPAPTWTTVPTQPPDQPTKAPPTPEPTHTLKPRN